MPPPELTGRQKVYVAMRDAGEKGVTDDELVRAGVNHFAIGMHTESLRLEGHGIHQATEQGKRGTQRRWFLTRDAWA